MNGIVYDMSFSVLYASIAGISLPDSWKNSFIYCIGDGKCGLNDTSSMEVSGFSVFEVNIQWTFSDKNVSLYSSIFISFSSGYVTGA